MTRKIEVGAAVELDFGNNKLTNVADGVAADDAATVGQLGSGGDVATDTIWNAKGDLAAGTGADTAARLAVGTNDFVLVADSAQTTGLKWAAVPGTSAFIPVATIDAKGDLLVGSANDAVDNLPVGSDGQILEADSTQTLGVKWGSVAAAGSVIAARVYNSATQSITASTDTALTFDTENFDTDTIHSTSSNTSRLTCKTAGKYIVQAQVEWDANATGVRIAQLKLNGTTVIASNRKLSLSTGVTQMLVETVYDLAVNDYLEVVVNQTSLGALNVNNGAGTSWFGMVAQAPQGATGAAGSTSYATPAVVLGSAAAAGAASSVIRSDSTIAAFDATSPSTQAFGDAAAVGTAAFAARRDHKHAMPAAVGISALVYRYTVAGTDKASIDTGADTADAGSGDWTGGDLLEVFLLAKVDNASAVVNCLLTFNNDTSSIYDLMNLQGTNVTASASNVPAGANLPLLVHGAGGTTGYASSIAITVPGYAGTTFNKSLTWVEGTTDNTAGNNFVRVRAGGYRSATAITRLKVAGNSTDKFKVGTVLLVYKRTSS